MILLRVVVFILVENIKTMDRIMLYLVCLIVFAMVALWMASTKSYELFDQQGAPQLTFDNTDVYMINLDRNAERLESFIEQYMQSELRYKQFQRIPAVDGSTLNIKEYVTPFAYKEITEIEKTGYRTKHYQLTRGAIGCYLSHVKAYNLISKADADYAIIFEDDAWVDPAIMSKLNKVLGSMDNSWDILVLGCHCIVCEKHDTYSDIQKFFLLHGYVIKKSSAEKLGATLQDIKISQQIDSEMSDMATQGQLRIYCLKTQLAKQKALGTDIQMPLKVMPGVNPYTTLI